MTPWASAFFFTNNNFVVLLLKTPLWHLPLPQQNDLLIRIFVYFSYALANKQNKALKTPPPLIKKLFFPPTCFLDTMWQGLSYSTQISWLFLLRCYLFLINVEIITQIYARSKYLRPYLLFKLTFLLLFHFLKLFITYRWVPHRGEIKSDD